MYGRFKIPVFICLLIFLAGFAQASENEANTIPDIWTVSAAVKYALHNNPDSEIALQRLAAAQAAITMADASSYPQLSVTGRYSQTDNPMYSFGNILNQSAFDSSIDFNNPGRTDDFNTGLHLNYLLYNGGSNLAALNAAKAGADAAKMAFESARSQLAFGAVKSFNQIAQAEEIVQVHTVALKEIDALLEVAKARFNEGILLKTDLLNLEVQQSASRENLIRAKNHLEVAKRIFLNLLGIPDGQVIINPREYTTQSLPTDTSYTQRFEILNAEAMLNAAKFRLRQIKGANSPTVEAFADYDYDQGWEMDGNGDSWQAGVQLQYNLFDGHHQSAATAEATARLAEAKAQLHKTEMAISLEVKQAELALDDADNRLLVTEKGVELALESARITRARFKEGSVLSSDLIAVENRLTDAQLRRSFAETAHRIAVANLRRAFGLPQFEEVNENLANSTRNETSL